ncbi:hypothetical protein V6Z12_A11G338000 [Gossypium hirsutum]
MRKLMVLHCEIASHAQVVKISARINLFSNSGYFSF